VLRPLSCRYCINKTKHALTTDCLQDDFGDRGRWRFVGWRAGEVQWPAPSQQL